MSKLTGFGLLVRDLLKSFFELLFVLGYTVFRVSISDSLRLGIH